MERLPRTRKTLLGGLCAALLGCQPSGSPESAPRNLILVTAQGFPHERLRQRCDTGELEALSAWRDASRRWEECWAPSSSALASSASLLTGQQPWQHGVRMEDAFRLPDSVPTLADRFGDHGCHTAAFLSSTVLHRGGVTQDFDVAHVPVIEKLQLSLLRDDAAPVTRDQPVDRWLAAIEAWLHTARSPFFLWVHLDMEGLHPSVDASWDETWELGLQALESLAVLLDEQMGRAARESHTVRMFAGVHGVFDEDLLRNSTRDVSEEVLRVPVWWTVPGRPDETVTTPTSLAALHRELLDVFGHQVDLSDPPRPLFESVQAWLEAGAPWVGGVIENDRRIVWNGSEWHVVDAHNPSTSDAVDDDGSHLWREFRSTHDPSFAVAADFSERSFLERLRALQDPSLVQANPESDRTRWSLRWRGDPVAREHSLVTSLPELVRANQTNPNDGRIAEMLLAASLRARHDERIEQSASSVNAQALTVQLQRDLPYRSLPGTIFIRDTDQPRDRRLEVGRRVLDLVPDWLPAIRTVAGLLQQTMQNDAAHQVLQRFLEEAPLSPEARREFEERWDLTRQNTSRQ